VYLEAASDSSSEWKSLTLKHKAYLGIRSGRICASVHTDWRFASSAGNFFADQWCVLHVPFMSWLTLGQAAPAPTISDSVEALTQVMNDLWAVLSEVTDITAKLSSKDTLSLEEVDEVRLLPAAKR
jgi:hypothetical protein